MAGGIKKTQLLKQQPGQIKPWVQAAACGVGSQGGLWNHLLHGGQLLSALSHILVCAKLIFSLITIIKSIIYSVAHMQDHSSSSFAV